MHKIITIAFDRTIKGFNEEVLSKFIINKQVKGYQAEFFQNGDDVYLTLFMKLKALLFTLFCPRWGHESFR